jgi:hypothetical protein
MIDGGVKSPISALRRISRSLRRTLSRPHSSRFTRLELELFSPPSQIFAFYRFIMIIGRWALLSLLGLGWLLPAGWATLQGREAI